MAATAITTLRPLMFSYEFQRLDFSTDQAEMSVVLKSTSDDTLLAESYTPDRYGSITLWDLDTEINAYIGDAPYASFTLTVDSALMATIKVLRSSVAYNLLAADFCASHFLTSWEGVRRTSVGRYECLSFYADSVAAVTAAVVWMTSAGAVRETVTVRAADYSAGSVVMVDVSPSKFVRAGRTLAGYRIICGGRSVNYRVDYPAIEAEPSATVSTSGKRCTSRDRCRVSRPIHVRLLGSTASTSTMTSRRSRASRRGQLPCRLARRG